MLTNSYLLIHSTKICTICIGFMRRYQGSIVQTLVHSKINSDLQSPWAKCGGRSDY